MHRLIVPNIITCSCILLFTFHLSLSAQPENWELRNYTIRDGLPSNSVNCFAKDKAGFLWIGTDQGLCRFDGYAFTYILLPSGEKHVLSKIKILSLLKDNNGILWAGTSEGLFRYDPGQAATKIRQYRYLPGSEGENKIIQPVNKLFLDSQGRLWFTCTDLDDFTNFGLRYFDINMEKFTYLLIDTTFSADQHQQSTGYATYIIEDSKGNIWTTSSSGLSSYDETTGMFTSYLLKKNPDNPLQNHLTVVLEDNYGKLWAGSRFGLYLFDQQSKTFGDPVRLDSFSGCYGTHADMYFMDIDSLDYAWMRVNNKLVRLKLLKDGSLDLNHITKYEFPVKVLKINVLTGAYIETPYIMWLGVPGNGLYQVFIRRKSFQTILPENHVESYNGAQSIVTAVYEDNQKNLWFDIPNSGVVYMNTGQRIQKNISVNPTEFINAINEDEYGNLWFFGRYGVASRKEGNRYVVYRPDTSDESSITYRDDARWEGVATLSAEIGEKLLLKDQCGTLWFNSGKGILDRYDQETDGFYHLDFTGPVGYNNQTPVNWHSDQERFLPTSRGLLRISGAIRKDEHFQLIPEHMTLYRHDPSDSLSISSDLVLCMHVSKHYKPGTIWIATMDGGLNRLEIVNDEAEQVSRVYFSSFTESDGLCDNSVMNILEDSLGYLWLGTHSGLSRFDPETGVFNNFYEVDGLPADHFTCADACLSSDGWMNFPTESGLLRFHPSSIQNNETPPPVALTNFMIYNKPVIPGEGSLLSIPVTEYNRLKLKHNQNFLSFEFAALNYELPEKNLYRYKLEGLDPEWINAGRRHFVEYPALRPGNYTVRVLASNNDGYWNNEGISLSFRISPPPWFAWYAYLFYGLLLVAAFMAYRRYLLSKARMKAELEIEKVEKEKIEELEKVKSRFFANISHEFRTPLTLIAGPVNDLLSTPKDPVSIDRPTLGMMARNVARLKRLINQLLEATRLEAGEMQLTVRPGDPVRCIKKIAYDFASLASSKKIKLSEDYPYNTVNCFFDADKIEKVLYNLLSNAVKFTSEGGEVSLIVRYQGESNHAPDLLEMIVKDNGIGIPADQLENIFKPFYQVSYSDTSDAEGTGLGLSLTRELVKLHRGEINVESVPGAGTTFTVRLPVIKHAFSDNEILVEKDTSELPEGMEEVKIIPPEEQIDTNTSRRNHSIRHSPVILVAEDNEDLRDYISGILDGYSLVLAENGMKALNEAVRKMPDLILTDIMMPKMNGVDLCRRIREDMRTSHIPVIMLTAKANVESKMEGLEKGADDYLVKPFYANELKLKIRNMLHQREKLIERIRDLLLSSHKYQQVIGDNPFLSLVYSFMEAHYMEEHFTVDDMAEALNMSRSQFYRKTHSETGTTPNELLQKFKIEKSAQMLRSGNYNVAQAMFESGFQSPSNFSKLFRKYKGMNPSVFRKSISLK